MPAGLPVVLDWSELHAGPERAGGTAGFLLLAGNLGGVILVLIIQAAIGNPYISLGALAVACLSGLPLTVRLPARFDSIALHWVTDNRHLDRIRYDPALLRLAGIPRSKLPDLLPATDILRLLATSRADALGVPAGIPVVVGTPDLHRWPSACSRVPGVGPDGQTGRTGSHGVIFTPWLYGERTPVEDRFVRGGFHNLSLSASRDDIVRAVFEGVAVNTRWLLQAVERFTRHRLEPIRFIGGGARSDVWCQIFADVLGRTIEQVADPVNANARGADLLAAVTLGDLTFDDVPDRVQVANSYEPDQGSGAIYDTLFREFTGLYRRNRRAYARLNREPATR